MTLVEDGQAQFPDAPTARGARHLRALTSLLDEHTRAAIVFVIQRSDATSFAPHDAADPTFGTSLRDAANAGVAVYAWTCQVRHENIAVDRQISVCLS